MIIAVNGHDLRLELADGAAARALSELVGDGGLELTMTDYGGFEKVGQLPRRLPTDDQQITTRSGDVTLYQGDQLSVYYDTNSWSLTRIGRIQGLSAAELRGVLGDGEVMVVLRNG